MAKDIRKQAKPLRDIVSQRVPGEDKGRFRDACKSGEQETAVKAKEFVKRIEEQDDWALEDWCELADLADLGRTLMEMRIAMT